MSQQEAAVQKSISELKGHKFWTKFLSIFNLSSLAFDLHFKKEMYSNIYKHEGGEQNSNKILGHVTLWRTEAKVCSRTEVVN